MRNTERKAWTALPSQIMATMTENNARSAISGHFEVTSESYLMFDTSIVRRATHFLPTRTIAGAPGLIRIAREVPYLISILQCKRSAHERVEEDTMGAIPRK